MSSTRTSHQSPASIFKSFSWHNPSVSRSEKVELVEFAHDIGNGIATLLSLIEFNDYLLGEEDAPLLTETSRGEFLRLAITSSKLLARYAHDHISHANQAALKAQALNPGEGGEK